MAVAAFTGTRRFIFKSVLTILLLVHPGSVTAVAQQVTSDHETAPAGSDAAAPDQQLRTTPADQSVASLVELLKKKNVISAEEAASLTEQAVSGAPGYDQKVASLVELLKKKNVISADEAAGLAGQAVARRDSEKAAVIASETNQKEQIEELNQRVSHVTQKVAELYSGKVAELAAAAPEWSKRIRFGGDVRLRYERDRFDNNNDVGIPKISQGAFILEAQNTWTDEDLFKYRVRVGAEVDIAEDITGNIKLQAAVRLATGNTTNPVSTNTILGDFMNKDTIVLDPAYLKLSWKTVGYIPTVYTLYGGRMPNPWFSSDLIWDGDLNFEGLALNVKKPLTETETWTAFLTAGAFPLQHSGPGDTNDSQHNKWLYAGQIGVERKHRTGIAAKVGAAYYHFDNITGVSNPDPLVPGATDWSAPLFQQRGNALFLIDQPNSLKEGLASEFRELNLTGTLDIGYWDPVHVVLLGDYVKNLGFNRSDVAKRIPDPNYPDTSTGYQIGLSVGRPAIETDFKWSPNWKVFLYYKYLEGDAVVDAFTDSDFHLGGTNARGWILGTEFGLMKNTWLTLRWLTADEISGPPLAIDVLQADVNAKF
jgi:hypothetical protein